MDRFTKGRFILALLACIVLMLLVLATPRVPVARADGGAPNLAYVAGSAQGVSIIDVGQQKVTGNLPAKGDPHTILLSPDARFLYVTEPQLGKLSVIAAKTGETICSADVPGQPSLLAMDPNGAGTTPILFVAGNGASSVTALDPTNCSIKRTFQANGPVRGLGIAAVGTALTGTTGNQLWVSAGNSLVTFDDNSGKEIGSVDIPGGAGYVSIPPGGAVYVTTQQGSVVSVGLSKREVTKLVTGGQYGPMDYDALTGEVYVPDMKNNQLVVLAPVNPGYPNPPEPSSTIKLAGVAPVSVAITSDGQLGFVALQDGNVVMLDIPGRGQVINTFPVGGTPNFIITGLYPPVIGTTPQQANVLGTIINIAAYIFVIALLIVPILLFRRYARSQGTKEPGKK